MLYAGHRRRVVVKRIVTVLGVETDLDVVILSAVTSQNLFDPVAEVAFHFENETANSLFFVASTIGKNLLREGVHAATCFAGPYRSENSDSGEQSALGYDQPVRSRCRDSFARLWTSPITKDRALRLRGSG